ncbi:MAG: endonuclease [Ignavibacteriales bacterium]|nr:endonuclease [Ignavibacteriales bacterium]
MKIFISNTFMQNRILQTTIIFLILIFSLSDLILAQAGTYYNTLNPSASTFVTDLENRIRVPYTKVSYDNFDETNIANFASINNGNGTRSVFCVYSHYEHIYSGTFSWLPMSREHTYCHSWQPGHPSTSLNEYSDQYHLFPTHQDNANGVRSNHPLGEVVNVISTFLEGKFGTDINGNQVYEPRDEHKGDAARAILYMPVRYNGINGYDWTFNWLNNTRLPSLGEADQDLATLIQWHKQDPPDKWEVDRNNYIQSIQQNRNPFVDHPEYVNYINFDDLTKYNPVYAVEPTNYVTNFSAGSTSSSIIFNWNDALAGTQIPSDYLLVIYDRNNYFIPIDGEIYSDDTNISDGKVVINISYADINSYELTGVANNTTYYGTIFSSNGSGSLINYKINETLPIASVLFNGSVILEPTNYATNFSPGTITSSSIQCTWIDALPGTQQPSGYLLLANGTGIFSSPVDGIVYSDDTNLADGSATVNISYSGADSYSFSSLNPTTNYYFKMFSYNGAGSSINYKIDGIPPTFNAQTSSGSGGGTLTELFISEYVEGTSNNKAIEIFNGTSGAINLTSNAYKLEFYFNGATTAATTINLSGTINPGNVFVVASSLANSTILNVANQTSSSAFYNGNDAIVLKKGSTIVDVIGQVGFNPGTEWGSGLISTADNTLRRLETTTQGDINPNDVFNPATEWIGYSTDTFDGLGTFTPVQQTFQFTAAISNGWNLVSIPGLLPINQNIDSWWIERTPTSGVYQFNNGYQSVTTLVPGIGYWLDNAGEIIYNTGDEWPASGILPVTNDPINIIEGWNLVGIYNISIETNTITTIPTGILTGSFFKYIPNVGYQTATILEPGYAYWIQATSSGVINLP